MIEVDERRKVLGLLLARANGRTELAENAT